MARASRFSPTRASRTSSKSGGRIAPSCMRCRLRARSRWSPRAMRFGVEERTLFDGTIATALTRRGTIAHREDRAPQQRRGFRDLPASFVCESEKRGSDRRRAETARAPGLGVASHPGRISRVRAALDHRRQRLRRAANGVASEESRIAPAAAPRLRVMQSNGSAIGVGLAQEEPVRTILSGPAAGVIGAGELARAIGTDRFITFDMGGTSTDVSMFDRRARIRTLSYQNGYAVRTPVIDIHTVGAGGGSIARVDAGGALRVGPESAGANPGPACYGRGDLPTVTDADLVAGRIVAENFLGGRMKIFPDRSARAMRKLAAAMRTTPTLAARGVIRVVNANMERAIRVITVERGFDPRDFALLAFGGAGPMHACELALDLGIRHIVLPRNPGLAVRMGRVGRADRARIFDDDSRGVAELSQAGCCARRR